MDDPKQLNGETQDKPIALTGSIDLFDINILPQRYRRKRIRLLSILPWFLFIVLLGLLYFSGIMALEAQAQYKRSQIELAQVQSVLEDYQSSSEELESLENEIEAAYQLRDQITASYQGIDLSGSRWNDTLFRIERIVPEGISLTLVAQQDNQIFLEGISTAYPIILDLVEKLNGLNTVQSVQIESVTQIVEEEPEAAAVITEDESQPITSISPSYSFSILTIRSGEGGLP